MFVYVGRRFIENVAGQRTEAVTCQKCGTAYRYELARWGKGSASAPYLIDQQGAERRAATSARRDLVSRLSQEAEMVPCPQCHWVNADLVERYRLSQYRHTMTHCLVVLGLGFLASILCYGMLTEHYAPTSLIPPLSSVAVLAVAALIAGGLLLRRQRRRLQIDPNLTWPKPPRLPPGTPPALMEQRNPHTGNSYFKPIARPETDELTGRADGVLFRPGEFELPMTCCVCLELADTEYASPLPINERSDLAVPLCKRCLRRLNTSWWMLVPPAIVLAMALAAGAALALAKLAPDIDATGRWIAFAMLAFFGALFAIAFLPGRMTRPYRYRVIDGSRGIVMFAAKNPQYTALLVEQAHRASGVNSATRGPAGAV